MSRPAAVRRAAALLAALGLLPVLVGAGGCSSGGDRPQARVSRSAPTAASPAPADPPQVYVAVGASETVGVGADDPATQAWPRVLHDRALAGTRFVDVGVSGATVRDALTGQLARALAEDPDVVTVWLAVNDALSLVPVADYEQSLGNLVHALRQGGRTEVLVGNVPPLDRLPAYRACLPGSGVTEVPCALPLVPGPAQVRATVAEFNAAIGRVVAREGAVLVDLSAERDLAGLTSKDGFHPSTRGHRVVARAFAAALRSG
jgi:lysophospholipase L1-like esterase